MVEDKIEIFYFLKLICESEAFANMLANFFLNVTYSIFNCLSIILQIHFIILYMRFYLLDILE